MSQTPDPLTLARQALQRLRPMPEPGTSTCEISEESEESPLLAGLSSHNSLISQSVPVSLQPNDPLVRARHRVRELRGGEQPSETQADYHLPHREWSGAKSANGFRIDADCEVSEESEERSGDRLVPPPLTDPFRAWRLRNATLLAEAGGRLGHDYGGYCAEHGRCLSYPEQKRGACSWCVPVDPESEPAYWASHWRRFTEWR